jgi:acyl carrier protein
MEKSEILIEVTRIIAELFEIEPERIQADAQLYTDLEIDSIDAVDLAAELRTLVGKKMAPEDFKLVRTVQDVVDAVYNVQGRA